MICSILRDEKESENVLEDAFPQMRKGVATHDANRNGLFTWAVMISRYKAIERLHERPHLGGTGFRTSQANDRAALSSLDATQREALEQAFFSGLTLKEIS